MQAVERIPTKEFLATAEPLIAEGKTFVVVFTGGLIEESGKSWCGPCEEVSPLVKGVLIPRVQKNGVPVFYVNVGMVPEWRDKENPLRVHPVYQVTGIPTALVIKNGKVSVRLIGSGDITEGDLLESFISAATP